MWRGWLDWRTRENGAKVFTLLFLEPRFNAVSAIWAVNFNGGPAIGNNDPSVVVHNPNALNPVALGFLPADHEYSAILREGNLDLSKTKGLTYVTRPLNYIPV